MSARPVKIDDDELRLLIYGQRRLVAKLRGDAKYRQRHDAPLGLIADIERQQRDARKLHARLMDIATSRGMTIPVYEREQQ